jgi:hypothetical protein
MKRILTEQWIAVISGLVSLILGSVLYAYNGDQKELQKSINIEVQQRRSADSLLNISIIEKIQQHEEVDLERNIRYDQDITEIKQSIIDQGKKIDKILFLMSDK